MSFCIVNGIPQCDQYINIHGVLEGLISGEIPYFDRIWIDRKLKRIWVDHIYKLEFEANLYCDVKGRCDDHVKYLQGYKVMLIL